MVFALKGTDHEAGLKWGSDFKSHAGLIKINIKVLVRSEIGSREYRRFWTEIAQAFQEAGCTPSPNLSRREPTHTPS